MPSTLPGNSDGPAGPRAANWPPPARSHCWTLSRERPRLHAWSRVETCFGWPSRPRSARRPGRPAGQSSLGAGTGGFWCVRVNDRGPFRFVLDTGSAVSAVSRFLAGELRLPAAAAPSGPVVLQGSTGAMSAERVVAKRVGVAGCSRERWTMIVLPDASTRARRVFSAGISLSPAARPAVRRRLVHARRGRRVRCRDDR